MKKVFLVRTIALMLVVNLIACSDEKKPAATETATTATSTTDAEKAAPVDVTKQAAIHPTEQKMYDFSDAFMNKIEAAVAEPDDSKAITMLNNIENEMMPQLTALQPEMESWMTSLSESERTAFSERLFSQPSTVKAFQMMGNPKLAERSKKNPKFREAFENANAGSSKLYKGTGNIIEGDNNNE